MAKKTIVPVSVCIITRNAAETVADALDSAVSFCSVLGAEAIVVDTGSTDETPVILKKYASQKKISFYSLPQADADIDFAAARNECLKHAAGAWILAMDADDIIAPSTIRRIKSLLEYEGADAYVLTKRSYSMFGGAPLNTGAVSFVGNDSGDALLKKKLALCRGFTDVSSIRLFKNTKKSRFRYRVFETIEDSLVEQNVPVAQADIIIPSFPSGTLEQACAQKELFLRILEQQAEKQEKAEIGKEAEIPEEAEMRKEAEKQEEKKKNKGRHAEKASGDKAEQKEADPKIFFDAASLHDEFGREDAALAYYKKAADADHAHKRHPDMLGRHTSLFFRIASLFLKKGQHEQAEFWLRKSLDLNPGFRNSYVLLASLFFHHSRPRSALQVLVSALKNNLKDVEIMNMVGFGLIQENKLDEAVKILETARAEAEAESESAPNQDTVPDTAGSGALPAVMTNTLSPVVPGIDLIYNNLYTAKLLKGEGDAAISILQEGIKKYPSIASFYTNLIAIFVQTRQPEHALNYCRKALALELTQDVRKHVESVEKSLRAGSEIK